MIPRSATAQLRPTDLARSIRFCTEVLGPELAFRDEDFRARLRAGGRMLHLKQVDAPDPSAAYAADGGQLHLCLETDDAAALADAVARRSAALAAPLHETPWGMRDFVIRDDQGHTLHFGQQV